MTDNLDVNDNKDKGKITEDLGQSPLEQAVGPRAEAQASQPGGSVASEGSAFSSSSPPSVPPPRPPAAKTPVDLPPGVGSAPTSQSASEPPAQSVPLSEVLEEKPTTSTDPAVLDALKAEDFPKPPASPDRPATTPSPDLGAPDISSTSAAPVAPPPVPEPPKPEGDLGEPTKAPDTDEFLKSILDDKTGMPEGSVAGDAGFGAKDKNQEINPFTEQSPVPSPPVPEPVAQGPETLVPPTPSLSDKSPIDGTQQNQPAKPTAGVGIDSISGAETPEAQADDMIAQANRPKGKSSPLRILLAILLAIVVVAVGYYIYTLLFSAEESTGIQDTSDETESSAGLTGTEMAATDDEQRKADLAIIQEALLNYYAGEGQFPVAEQLALLTTGNILETALVPTYLTALPADPSTAKNYGYKSDGLSFTLTAMLDDTTDSEAVVKEGKAVYSLTYPVAVSGSPTPATASSAITTE